MTKASVLSALVLILLVTVALPAQEVHQVEARKTTSIVIDGHLEDGWLEADPATNFTQVEPHEGKPASMPTFVYFLYDDNALYVGVDCREDNPDSIRGHLQRRDTEDNSDVIYINIDTFHDRTNGFYFGLTPAGVQIDGTISQETQYDDTWNGIWQSAVKKYDNGWIAEFRIPFRSFRHGGERDDGWGLNISRVINRLDEWSTWAPISRDKGNRVNKFGNLVGIREIPSDRFVEILPHVVASWDQSGNGDFRSRNEWENFGFDLKFVPSPTWTLDVTYQPDFAQVDVDDEVIHLSPYPIYLEERRPFFIEGLALFNQAQYELLYTRKITDPDMGARVTGKRGNARGTVLAAQNVTEDDVRQNISAGTIEWKYGKRNTIGATYTSLDDKEKFVGSASVNGRVRWGEINSFSYTVASVDKKGLENQPIALFGNLFVANDNGWRAESGIRYKGQDFDINDLGFDGYSNVLLNWNWAQKRWHFENSPLRSLYMNFNFYHEAMPDGKLYERSINFNDNIEFSTGHWMGFGANWGSGFFRNRPDDDDEDIDLTIFRYRDNFEEFDPRWLTWQSRWFWINTDSRRPVELEFEFSQGSHREGHQWATEWSVEVKPTSTLNIKADWDYNRIYRTLEVNDGAMTDYQIFRLRTRYSPTLDLSFRATVQYRTESLVFEDRDGDSALLGNFLVAWNWSPGSWFYLVYNDNRDRDYDEDNPFLPMDWSRGDRAIQLKWTYFFTAP